jgi:hypothetical protein
MIRLSRSIASGADVRRNLQVPTDTSAVMVAPCGLVCSDCGAYKRHKCQGCHAGKPLLARCPVRACVQFRQYRTCAECTPYHDLTQCHKLHNFISRFFGWVFHTDRIANLRQIRAVGLDAFKDEK